MLVDDIKKNVSTLENPAESVVKKRCIMKMSLGNYRQQMEKEKNKLPYGSIPMVKGKIYFSNLYFIFI